MVAGQPRHCSRGVAFVDVLVVDRIKLDATTPSGDVACRDCPDLGLDMDSLDAARAEPPSGLARRERLIGIASAAVPGGAPQRHVDSKPGDPAATRA